MKPPRGWARMATAIVADPDFLNQVAQPVLFQSGFDGVHHPRRIGMVGDGVALIEQGKTGLFGVRLAQDSADQLGHGREVGASGQGAEHVGERAIPNFLERLP